MNRVDVALQAATQTKALVIGAGVISQVGEMFHSQFPDKRAVIVADTNTYRIAGEKAADYLRQSGVELLAPFIFEAEGLYAEWSYIEQLDGFLAQNDAIAVAVGSGTINDLTKLSSSHNSRRYMCVATAASMDGYTAYGASITYKGAKQTFDCPAPQAVLADTDIIAAAPATMSASGYADLFAKVTAGADWILSDRLGIEKIDTTAWSIVQDDLKVALADPDGIHAGRQEAVTPLIEGLILGGFAMQWHRTSRPASGADHQFSHLWDMEHLKVDGKSPSHGFKVAIGMLASTALYEQLLAEDMSTLDVEACCKAWPSLDEAKAEASEMFAGTDFPTIGATEVEAKYVTTEQLRQQLTTLRNNWGSSRLALQSQIIPFEEVRRRLDAVGAPTTPEQIGVTRERLRDSFIRAQHIRRRFTILDVAVRCGLLDSWLDRIFAADGLWPIKK